MAFDLLGFQPVVYDVHQTRNLTICNVNPHFQFAKMYGWINVK